MRLLFHNVIIFLVLFLLPAQALYSAEKLGVQFPETYKYNGTTLNLVGVGVKQKYYINIYVRALYLEHPVDNRFEAITSDQKKRVVMHFVYIYSSPQQIQDAWREGFKNNNPDLMENIESEAQRFISVFDEALKPGDRLEFLYDPNHGLDVYIKGKKKGHFEDKELMEALLSMWFDRTPPHDDFWSTN